MAAPSRPPPEIVDELARRLELFALSAEARLRSTELRARSGALRTRIAVMLARCDVLLAKVGGAALRHRHA